MLGNIITGLKFSYHTGERRQSRSAVEIATHTCSIVVWQSGISPIGLGEKYWNYAKSFVVAMKNHYERRTIVCTP